ncbi:MAG: hypothetical protein Q9161_007793 [Pseudevernia consocians]
MRFKAGVSPEVAIATHNDGPDKRSKYEENFDLKKKSIELYKDKAKVYLVGARGVDPKPYKIYKVLGDGQYKLSRDGKSDGKVYRQEDLRSEP